MDQAKNCGISVVKPIATAIDRTKKMLFAPFDISRWFAIGFCAWLAALGGRGGFNCFRPLCNSGAGPNTAHIRYTIENNLYWIVPLGLFLLTVGTVLAIVLMWLRCRGQFMFLHCIASDKAQIAHPWKKYARQANSLFLFKLTVMIIYFLCLIPLAIGWIAAFLPIIRQERLITASMAMITALGVCTLFVSITFAITFKFTADFVTPIMYITRQRCVQAWKLFGKLLMENVGRFILYCLFQIVIGLCIGAIVIAAALATCGCFCCLAVIPYIGTVVMLPILVFRRSYSLCYLTQYGSDYDVFACTESVGRTTDIVLPEN